MKGQFRHWITAIAGLVMLGGAAAAQDEEKTVKSAPPDRFKLYRWQEDYSGLAKKPELNAYERLKYIRLGSDPATFLSLGGEARFRYDAYSPYLFGIGKSGKNFGSAQERLLVHGDLHVTPYFRMFMQLDAAAEDGRLFRRPYDESDPNLRQAFGDLILPVGPGKVTVRAGRQELWLGGSRWLSVRDPTNLRRSFDGALAEYADPRLTLRAFAARPVLTPPKWFDDTTSKVESFSGLYGTVRRPLTIPANFDLYLFSRHLDSATYKRGTGREDRWSLGGRVYGQAASLDYQFEGTYQFGTFRDSTRISAWGLYGDVSRSATFGMFAPRVGLRSQYASGDSNLKSGTLGTFVGPYPAASVIADMSLLSASNAFNLQPYLQICVGPDLKLGANWNFVWKPTIADSVYGPIGTLITASAWAPGAKSRKVAQIGQLDMTYDMTKFVQLHALYAHSFAGSYITAAKGRDFDYYRLQLMARW